jgi:hypothetical protein
MARPGGGSDEGRIRVRPWILHLARREAWLALVAPAWPRGYLRLLGAAGVVEGVILMIFASAVPILPLAVTSLVGGAGLIALTYVRRRR